MTTPNDSAHRAYVRAARQAKVLALIPVLQSMAVANGKSPLELARHLASVADPGLRARVCEFAGINPASSETWALVVQQLERAERLDDVFDRVVEGVA